MIRRRWIGAATRVALAVVGAVAILLGTVTAPASAAPTHLLLSSDGVSFAPSLSGGLFDDLGQLVPGESMAASLWVRNASPDAAVVRVVVADLVVPSAAFATGVTLLTDDGVLTREVVLDSLQKCSAIVPSRDVPAGATVRIDLMVAMLETVTGLDAQNESADLDFDVTMRDAAAGPFPAADGCAAPLLPDTPGGDRVASTGVDIRLALIAAAGFVVAGILLFLVRRRRRDDPEPTP